MSFYDQFLLWELKQGYWAPYFKVFNEEVQELSEDFCLYNPIVTEETLLREGIKEVFPDLSVDEDELCWGLEKSYDDCRAVEAWFIDKGWGSVFEGWLKTNEGWKARYGQQRSFLGRGLDPRTLTLDLFRQYYWESYGIGIKYEFSEVELRNYFFRRLLNMYGQILGFSGALGGLQAFLWSTGSDAIIYKIYVYRENPYYKYEDWVLVDALDLVKQEELNISGYVSIPAIAVSLDILSQAAVSVDDIKSILLNRIIPVTVSVYWIVNGFFYIDGLEVHLKEEEHLACEVDCSLKTVSVYTGRKVYDIMCNDEAEPYQLRRKIVVDDVVKSEPFGVLELK